MIGNDDVRKILEVALLLIDKAKDETQNAQSIRKLRDALAPALQFLEDHPGPPPVPDADP